MAREVCFCVLNVSTQRDVMQRDFLLFRRIMRLVRQRSVGDARIKRGENCLNRYGKAMWETRLIEPGAVEDFLSWRGGVEYFMNQARRWRTYNSGISAMGDWMTSMARVAMVVTNVHVLMRQRTRRSDLHDAARPFYFCDRSCCSVRGPLMTWPWYVLLFAILALLLV